MRPPPPPPAPPRNGALPTAHHRPDIDTRGAAFLRWRWQRLRVPPPPDPPRHSFPLAEHRVAWPRASADRVLLTWIGQSTVLVQIGGLNLLTDPMWGRRASPVAWAGPARLSDPGMPFEALPPLDGVLLSHDHYDHLDEPTVHRLRARFPDVVWFVPVGYRRWFELRGVRGVVELPWWRSAELVRPAGRIRVTAVPARHWARRAPLVPEHRGWAAWTVHAPAGRSVFFGGDSGYFGGFREIGERLGPFDAVLLPVGAYEPRWFMAPAHMDPGEAVAAYLDLGGRGRLLGIHWGTFRLTDEDALEPPSRTRRVWERAGLPPEDLLLPPHGTTSVIPALPDG